MREYDRIREMISRISSRSASKVKLYTESQPVFDRFNITRQLENTFSRQVHLKGGGYLVVDETEALVAIDVNTGRHKSGKDQESTILKVNLEAAEEICRQLRLRNMGGLIVLDFIDMKSRRDQQSVYQRIKEGLRRDKAKTHVLPISQLGLMEMTRQRHSESVRSAVYDDCPYCKGRGKVKSVPTMSVVEIQRKLAEILKKTLPRAIRISNCASPSIPRFWSGSAPRTRKLLIELEKKVLLQALPPSGPGFARGAVQDRECRHQRGTGRRRFLRRSEGSFLVRHREVPSWEGGFSGRSPPATSVGTGRWSVRGRPQTPYLGGGLVEMFARRFVRGRRLGMFRGGVAMVFWITHEPGGLFVSDGTGEGLLSSPGARNEFPSNSSHRRRKNPPRCGPSPSS